MFIEVFFQRNGNGCMDPFLTGCLLPRLLNWLPQVHVLQRATNLSQKKIEKYNPTQKSLMSLTFLPFLLIYPWLSLDFRRFSPFSPGVSRCPRHCRLHPRSGAAEADGQRHGPGLAAGELHPGDAQDTAGWEAAGGKMGI